MKRIIFSCLSLALAAFPGLTTNLHADTAAPTNSTEAILQHPGFHEGLVWIGSEPGERESARLLQIIGDLKKPFWPSEVEGFFADYPDSPWAASLHYAYASFCHRTGRTTKALEHWEAAWNLVKDDTSGKGSQLGSAILANWTGQLSSLGRRDKLRELIPAGDRWPFANRQDREKFESAKNNYYLMGRHPELSYRCGTLALRAVAQALEPTNTALQSLIEIGSPVDGFSMAGLADLSKQYGLPFVAVRRREGDDLIVPSVIHWRQNHYAAILKQDGDNFFVNDPTSGKPHWMQRQAINEEASGNFLIPASKQTAQWQTLGSVELASIHGKGLTNNINDGFDKGCTTTTGNTQNCGCTSPSGMPVWWVSEPYNNVWIADEPLSYLTSTGEPFTFRLSYKQRDSRPSYIEQGGAVANVGWNMSWFSYVSVQSSSLYYSSMTNSTNLAPPADYPTFPTSGATLYLGNGGEVDFSPGQMGGGQMLLAGTGVAGGLESLSDSIPSGLGDLNMGEFKAIQAAVDDTGQSLTVVGSAASGTRNAASDIDYLFNSMPEFPSEMTDLDEITSQLPSMDPSHGPLRGPFNPYMGPGISFTPGQAPVVLPAAH